MASITAANTIIMLGVTSLYNVPQQLQGYAADDVFDSDAISPAEIMMGVDGVLSAGMVHVPIPQNFTLQADSASNTLFEAWYASQQAAQDIYFAFGVVQFPGLNKAYQMSNGVLTSYHPAPDAKKVLQPRKYQITWESIIAAPV